MPLPRLLLCGALACALPALALAQDDRAGAEQADRSDAYSLRLSETLAAKGGARNLALAAWLRDLGGNRGAVAGMPNDDTPSQAMPEDAQSGDWRRAAAQARDRDLITDLLLSASGGDIGHAAATRWAAAEPDNAAPLFFQGLSVDALLAAMRTRQRFDLHFVEETRWLADVYAANPPNAAELAPLSDDDPPLSRDAVVVNGSGGLWATVAIPNFTDLVRACRDQALRATPTRAADCAAAADVMAGASDTAIGRLIGIGLRERSAADEAGRVAAQRARRQSDWQLSQWGEIAQSQPDNGAPQFLRLLRDPSVHTEIDLIGRALKEANVPLDPPAGWQPPRPPQRPRP